MATNDKCPACGASLTEGANECPDCGIDLVRAANESAEGGNLGMEVPLTPEMLHRMEVMKHTQAGASTQSQSQTPDVGGWLLLFCVSLTILSPAFALVATLREFVDGAPYFAQLPGLLVTTITAAGVTLGITAFGVHTGYRLWKVHPRGIRTAKVFLFVLLGSTALAGFLPLFAGLPKEANNHILANVTLSVVRTFGYVAIWYAYLLKSRRVRETFAGGVEHALCFEKPLLVGAIMLFLGSLGIYLTVVVQNPSAIPLPRAPSEQMAGEWEGVFKLAQGTAHVSFVFSGNGEGAFVSGGKKTPFRCVFTGSREMQWVPDGPVVLWPNPIRVEFTDPSHMTLRFNPRISIFPADSIALARVSEPLRSPTVGRSPHDISGQKPQQKSVTYYATTPGDVSSLVTESELDALQRRAREVRITPYTDHDYWNYVLTNQVCSPSHLPEGKAKPAGTISADRVAPTSVDMPDAVIDAKLTSFGAVLILQFRALKQAYVLDMATATLCGVIPGMGKGDRIAASGNRVLVYRAAKQCIEIWKMPALQCTATNRLDLSGPVTAMEMGLCNDGIALATYSTTSQGRGTRGYALISVPDLKVQEFPPPKCHETGWNSLEDSRDVVHIRPDVACASFLCWQSSGTPSGFALGRLASDGIRFTYNHEDFGPLNWIHAQKTVLTEHVGVVDLSGHSVTDEPGQLFPICGANGYLGLTSPTNLCVRIAADTGLSREVHLARPIARQDYSKHFELASDRRVLASAPADRVAVIDNSDQRIDFYLLGLPPPR